VTKPIVSIIGLGQRGAGVGLALQREPGTFAVVGHDKSPEAAQIAKRQGAIQRIEWNLHRAVEGADLVVATVPLQELDELLKLIGEDLKQGALVLAMTPLLQPAILAAERHLPRSVHFVAGRPVLVGPTQGTAASGTLFKEAVFALAAGMKTEAVAIQLASDFAGRLEATALFVDAQEHDGIMAGVEQLPQLLGAALMRLSIRGTGWREARRLAGRTFGSATEYGDDAMAIGQGLLDNRENLLLRLKQVQQELAAWAALLEAPSVPGEIHPLVLALDEVVVEREVWAAQAMTKRWEDSGTQAPVQSQGGFLRQMFLGGMGGRRTDRR
jgi:prephenate dehydrogenase